MKTIHATARVTLWGTARAWRIAPLVNNEVLSKECIVHLEIQGNNKNGYYLIMKPDEYLEADCWYESKEDALESASELFGVCDGDWC